MLIVTEDEGLQQLVLVMMTSVVSNFCPGQPLSPHVCLKEKDALILIYSPQKVDLVRELYKFLQDEHNQGVKQLYHQFLSWKNATESKLFFIRNQLLSSISRGWRVKELVPHMGFILEVKYLLSYFWITPGFKNPRTV